MNKHIIILQNLIMGGGNTRKDEKFVIKAFWTPYFFTLPKLQIRFGERSSLHGHQKLL